LKKLTAQFNSWCEHFCC